MRKLTMTAIAAALLALPASAAAQSSANVQAFATVLAPISVTSQQNLQFGDVIPGFTSTVAPADAGAGRFLLSGGNGLEVSLDFGTLPNVLDHTVTASTLPLSFGAASAGFGTAPTTVDATFDPSSPPAERLSGSGLLYVFLGGTVTPDVNQEAGDYNGTVTLTVAYTGS